MNTKERDPTTVYYRCEVCGRDHMTEEQQNKCRKSHPKPKCDLCKEKQELWETSMHVYFYSKGDLRYCDKCKDHVNELFDVVVNVLKSKPPEYHIKHWGKSTLEVIIEDAEEKLNEKDS